MRVALKNLGCKTNQAEGEAVLRQLIEAGFEPVSFKQEADVYLVNTCTVTSEADSKSRKFLRQARRHNPKAVVVATGCYAQRASNEIAAIKEVDLVINQFKTPQLAQVLFQKLNLEETDFSSFFQPFHPRAFLKIQDGCDHFCTYCIVPHVRGRERSLPIKEVVDGAKRLLEVGVKEIVLTGIRLGKYGLEQHSSYNLEKLLEKLLSLDGQVRWRLSSIDLFDVTGFLIDLMAKESRLCPHLHVPLQSGDDRVLERMGRDYRAKDFLSLASKFREKVPNGALTTDVMVGFPGEDEAAFAQTLKVLKEAKPSRLHVFQFSPRPGTPASQFKDKVNPKVSNHRVQNLLELRKELSIEFARQQINKKLQLVVEGKKKENWEGLSQNYLKVLFQNPSSLSGRFVEVIVERVEGDLIYGSLLGKEGGL